MRHSLRRSVREVALWSATLALVALACDFPSIPNPLVTAAATPPRDPGARPPRALLIGDSIMDEHGSHAAVALRVSLDKIREELKRNPELRRQLPRLGGIYAIGPTELELLRNALARAGRTIAPGAAP